MSDLASVHGFHAQGSDQGALLGVYHFNARAVHALTPQGGAVVDLGCGSGQYLKYLALRRPDLHLIGIDLSTQMVAEGNAMLREHSLADRVELRLGDMTSFFDVLPEQWNCVTSIFSMHHLPTSRELFACLGEMARARARHGAAIWIFDHARPRHRATALRFPRIFTPEASPAFNADSTNSLIASWSYEELRGAVTATIGETTRSSVARILPLYQVHWAPSTVSDPIDPALWRDEAPAAPSTLREAKALAGLFKYLPA